MLRLARLLGRSELSLEPLQLLLAHAPSEHHEAPIQPLRHRNTQVSNDSSPAPFRTELSQWLRSAGRGLRAGGGPPRLQPLRRVLVLVRVAFPQDLERPVPLRVVLRPPENLRPPGAGELGPSIR